MELPSLPTGVNIAHEGRLRGILNEIGWYAKRNGLAAEDVRRFFDLGIVANAFMEHCNFILDTRLAPSIKLEHDKDGAQSPVVEVEADS